MSKFQGIYATFLEQFIDFKRSLGYKFKDAEYTYCLFDRFTIQRGETEIGIDKDLADQWAVKRPNESDSTRYRRVMYLIQFAGFLNDSGYKAYMPQLPRVYKSTFTPYIFSLKEIESIFAASDRLEMDSSMNSTVNVMPAILRTLYGTGIRVGEAVTLKIKDVHLDDRYLIIRQTKNGKERMVPFSDSLADVLRRYRNSLQIAQDSQGHFFVKRNGYPCLSKAVYEWFRKILREASIVHGGKGQGPRLHDLRYPHLNKIRTFPKEHNNHGKFQEKGSDKNHFLIGRTPQSEDRPPSVPRHFLGTDLSFSSSSVANALASCSVVMSK